MGSKGSPTVQNTAQTYMANPAVNAASMQALSGAQSAAAQPFQMPVAPVAGFSPFQQQAFGQAQGLQGAAQPYVNQAGAFNTAAGTPVTGADVNAFYNPMAASVTANLQDIFGQQNVNNRGTLTQQAGGVGADRIAVGEANLAKQQGLAAGQTYSGLYQQALQAAEWQKQQQAQAAQGALGVGNANLQTQMAGTNLLNQYGTQQQQQTQQELNAPYQNTLARIAYQFQTPQYLAGIAGGLAPALGGTTQGQQVTNPPQPSIMSQILGLGTAGVGAYGAFGGFGGNPSYGGGSAFSGDAYGGNSMNPLPGLTAEDYGAGYADGGPIDATEEPIPVIPLKGGAGHSGPLTGGIQFSQPQQQQGSNTAGDITKALGTVAQMAPFFLADGGSVDAQGNPLPSKPPVFRYRQGRSFYEQPDGTVVPVGTSTPIGPKYADGGDVPYGEVPDFSTMFTPSLPFKERFGGPFAAPPAAKPDLVGAEVNPNPVKAGTVPLPTPYPGPGKPGSFPDAIRLDAGAKPADDEEETGTPKAQPGIQTAPPSAIMGSMMPTANQPYPDALNRDWGQNLARSPWLALWDMGAKIASTPGPLGVSIGKGMEAASASLGKQRTELRSEQELNQKAEKLYQDAQAHLDKYNRLTAAEREDVKIRNRELDQAKETGAAGIKPLSSYQRTRIYGQILEEAKAMGWDNNRILQEYNKRINPPMPGAAAPANLIPATPDQITMIKGAITAGKATKESAIAGAASKGIHVDPSLLE